MNYKFRPIKERPINDLTYSIGNVYSKIVKSTDDDYPTNISNWVLPRRYPLIIRSFSHLGYYPIQVDSYPD